MKPWVLLLVVITMFATLAGSAHAQGSADVATGFATGNNFVVTGSGDLWMFGSAPNPAGQWLGRATAAPPTSPVIGAFYSYVGNHRFFAVLRNGDVHAFGDYWTFDNARLIGNVFGGAGNRNLAAAFYNTSYGMAYAIAENGDVWNWHIQELVFSPLYVGNIFGAMPTVAEPTTWGRVKDSFRD